jgi:hypothetical protein
VYAKVTVMDRAGAFGCAVGVGPAGGTATTTSTCPSSLPGLLITSPVMT